MVDDSRRNFLRHGTAAFAGLSLTEWLSLSPLFAAAAPPRSCIVLWMAGGPSQIDTWDPKPGRPTGGEFRAIASAVAGIQVSEHLPQLAREMKDLAVIRSMTSREGNHQRARYLVHTGYPPQGPTVHPSLGALVASRLAEKEPELPPFVSINGPSAGPGILGVDVAPFVVNDPTRGVDNVSYPDGVDHKRFERRWALLQSLERPFLDGHSSAKAEGHWSTIQRSVDLMHSASLDAFDLGKESDKLRGQYGDTPFGQGCLMARRLVERGVRYVEVELGGWDTHVDNFQTTRNLMSVLDPAMSTLVRDLKQRDLLDSTLVVWMGEFGRTPRVNRRGGRDHYPRAWSAVLAGAGVRGGQVIGETDRNGEEIWEHPVTVPDLFASICHALRIDPEDVSFSPLGRPIPVTDGGNVVPALFS